MNIITFNIINNIYYLDPALFEEWFAAYAHTLLS
eukprot:COSAG06_NODE_1256_length_10087_cov_7.646676_8_plen_34_part_00